MGRKLRMAGDRNPRDPALALGLGLLSLAAVALLLLVCCGAVIAR